MLRLIARCDRVICWTIAGQASPLPVLELPVQPVEVVSGGKFALEPAPELGLPQLPDDKVWAVNLSQAMTFTGRVDLLLSSRVARMTAVTRRYLRHKLALLWGRVEEGDAAELLASGIQP